MEDRLFKVALPKNTLVTMDVIPGHFTTCTSHINNYLDMSNLKSNSLMARDVAKVIAVPYLAGTIVNTIVCMDNTEVIGAYLADELLRAGTSVMDIDDEINVVAPMNNVNNKLVFQNNMMKKIKNQNIILLVATISSGKTIDSALECLNYYGGILVGISALFSAAPQNENYKINAVFTDNDIPDYQFFSPDECVMCEKGDKLDAIINSEGYLKM